MKSNIKVAIAVFFAVAISAYAQDGFIRPEISYVKPSSKRLAFSGTGDPAKLNGAVGFALAGGTAYGDQASHEISLSLGLSNFSTSESQTRLFTFNHVLFSSDHDAMKVREIPLMLHYRYYTGARKDTVRFYFGPSLGATYMRRNETLTGVNAVGGAGVTMSASDTKIPWNWALASGVSVKLNDRMNLDAGFRFAETCSSIWGSHIVNKSLYVGFSAKL